MEFYSAKSRNLADTYDKYGFSVVAWSRSCCLEAVVELVGANLAVAVGVHLSKPKIMFSPL